MNVYLILEDGTIYQGRAADLEKEVISEIVFNTSMTGYQEILTDPSYAGQTVVMTYPLIGNYGVCEDDMESLCIWPDAMIVREFSRIPSNFRAENTIQNFLKKYHKTGISGIDTRDLVKKLRDAGTMNGLITSKRYAGKELQDVCKKLQVHHIWNPVQKVTSQKIETFPAFDNGSSSVSNIPKKVALVDFGTKRSMIRCLQNRGCDVTVFPSWTSAKEILNTKPDGIMLSNGPGDPKENISIIEEIRELLESGTPMFAICLGHQLMALALGGDTYKLKYGHRGANHPVRDMQTGKVTITSQNHGYAVLEDSLPKEIASIAYQNVNDGTNEGFFYHKYHAFSVQFHPEASPGPMDMGNLFQKFINMMKG